MHFTQTCDEDAPQLITPVETTPAAVNDEKARAPIHAGLAEKDLLPDQHLADAGYVDATNLRESWALSGVDLVGPPRKNDWYQAETGFDLTHFSLDWEAEKVTCPQGHISSSWTPAQDAKGKPVLKVKFSQTDGKACPSRTSCTATTRRTLTLQPRERMQALFAARQPEGMEAFKDPYRHRAGIEGTHSEARAHDGVAPLTLFWLAQNASGPCGYCYGDQCRSTQQVAPGRSTGSNPYLSL